MASTSTENVPPPAPSAPGSKLSAPGSAPAAAAPDHAPEPSAAEDDETGSQVRPPPRRPAHPSPRAPEAPPGDEPGGCAPPVPARR